MTQKLLPFNYTAEKKEKNLTGLSGLLLYVELFKALKLDKLIGRQLKIKSNSQGWRDDQLILALILLNLAGGESVSDICRLEEDEGFCRIMKSIDLHGKSGKQRTRIKKRWRQAQTNTVPSPSSIFRYLSYFHNESEELKRKKSTSFIPKPNQHLQKFSLINSHLIDLIQKKSPIKAATLDMDATIIPSHKSTALKSYKSCTGYSAFNVYWFEQDYLLHTEFRDGNVTPGYDQLRMLKESLDLLPESVEDVYIRSDSAGYQNQLLRYCNRGKNNRFGRIWFAIGCDINDYFRHAILSDSKLEWLPIYKEIDGCKLETGQEWAEVCYAPNGLCRSKKDVGYRFIAIRESLIQKVLPGMENQVKLPFPTIQINKEGYKITAFVTNLEWDVDRIIHWYRQRCGKSEQVHSVMKQDLAGGRLPSADFGENAAWWWIMILSLNLNSIMKRWVLKGSWKTKQLKSIRFNIINLPGRVVKSGREYIIRLASNHKILDFICHWRKRIWELSCLPAG